MGLGAPFLLLADGEKLVGEVASHVRFHAEFAQERGSGGVALLFVIIDPVWSKNSNQLMHNDLGVDVNLECWDDP